MAGRLEGKVAVITGAAHGIGRAAALLFAREGAAVVVADRDVEAGGATADEIIDAGGRALYVYTDVAQDGDIHRAIHEAELRWGGLDILVNNAAIAVGAEVHETPPELWQRIQEVNLNGVYRGCRDGVRAMLRRGGGAIVNVASVQGMFGFHGWAAYAASKGSVIALTRQMAVDYADRNIRVNAVCPGPIETAILERGQLERAALGLSALDAEEVRRRERVPPMGRSGRPEEVAACILFLASEEASYITGHCLVVDGGLTAAGD